MDRVNDPRIDVIARALLGVLGYEPEEITDLDLDSYSEWWQTPREMAEAVVAALDKTDVSGPSPDA